MKKGIIIILSLAIILLGSLSYVSAMDSDGQLSMNDIQVDDADSLSADFNVTDGDSTDAIKSNDGTDGGEDNPNDADPTNGNVIRINPKTFSDLYENIRACGEGSVLVLMNDCSLDEGFGCEGIPIEKQITLDGNGYSLDGKKASRILYVDADNVVLKNIKFVNGNTAGGAGALLIRACNTLIENCTFKDNSAKYGGAIYMEDYCKFNPTTCVSNITIINSYFEGNSASNGGGGIYSLSKENFIRNSTFKDNRAKTLLGGAIQLNNDISEIVNNSFIGNSAKEGAGVALQYSLNHFVANNTFTRNYAFFDGAALNLYGGGDYTVINNVFTENSADNLGGAIRFKITDSSIVSKISNNTFNSNNAFGGGAIYCDSDKAQFTYNTFINNKATSKCGGALQLNGNDNIISYNVVDGCSASYKGGAIYIENNANKISYNNITGCRAGNGGGAIFITGSSSTLNNNIVRNNNADFVGGAIQILGDKATLNDNVISDNVAKTNGGGVYIEGSNAFISANTFVNNKATSASGGAIWLSGKGSTISYNVIDKCSASAKGGAVFMNGNSNKVSYNNITNCHAGNGGGAIYILGSSSTLNNNILSDNGADSIGGAVQISGDKATLKDNVISDNVAKTNGGGVYLESNNAVISGNTFTANRGSTSSGSGGAIKLIGNYATVSSNTFNKNTIKYGPSFYGTGYEYSISKNTFVGSTQANQVKWDIVKQKTKLTTPAKKFKKSAKTKKVTVTLKSASGKVLASKKITIKVNKKTYSAKTNSKGQATVKVKLTKKGTYKYVTKFKGDSYFYSVSKTGKIVIK